MLVNLFLNIGSECHIFSSAGGYLGAVVKILYLARDINHTFFPLMVFTKYYFQNIYSDNIAPIHCVLVPPIIIDFVDEKDCETNIFL